MNVFMCTSQSDKHISSKRFQPENQQVFSLEVYGSDIVLRLGYDWNNDGEFEYDYYPDFPFEFSVTDISSDISGIVIIVPEINVPPTANFTYTPNKPSVDDIIEFTDTSTDSDGTIVSWWWDFDDGYYSDLRNPIHIYYTTGIYNVSLTVTDDDGDTNTFTVEVVVTNPSEEVTDLIEDIEAMNLYHGLENSLTKKLMNVLQSLEQELVDDAINQLNAFIIQVEEQRGDKLTNEQADYLIAEAQSIVNSL